MNITRIALTLGLLLGGVTAANATNIGFGQIGGNNAGIGLHYASNATVDAPGYTVALGGATPHVGLTWDTRWQVHHSSFFSGLETVFVGGGEWDNQGGQAIGQLDYAENTKITFTVETGYKLILTSFDMGLTGETIGNATWDITLTAVSSSTVVWSHTQFFNATTSAGQAFTFTPNFTGVNGESYVLNFNRTAGSYNSDGRAGIDNLQFSELAAVPEPSTYGFAFAAFLGALVFARRRLVASTAKA